MTTPTGLTKACSERSMPAMMSFRYPASVSDETVLNTAVKTIVCCACGITDKLCA